MTDYLFNIIRLLGIIYTITAYKRIIRKRKIQGSKWISLLDIMSIASLFNFLILPVEFESEKKLYIFEKYSAIGIFTCIITFMVYTIAKTILW